MKYKMCIFHGAEKYFYIIPENILESLRLNIRRCLDAIAFSVSFKTTVGTIVIIPKDVIRKSLITFVPVEEDVS